MRAAAVILAAGLSGCSGQFSIPPTPPPVAPVVVNHDEGPQAPAIVETPRGEEPAICYVRARHFRGLVPLSCDEAERIRP